MFKKIIFLLICFIASSPFAAEIRLKGKNGVERTFDIIAVSASNIFYLENNKTKKMPFNLLDEDCLKQYPQIQKLREKSKLFSEICVKGEESYDYSKVSPRKHIQKEGNRYVARSSLWSVGGGTLPVANYTEEEFSKEKIKFAQYLGRFLA